MKVTVVGGGIIGLLSALRLRQRGDDVDVYDISHIGKGASWAAAGLLAPEAENLGPEAIASRDAFPALIAELGGDIPHGRGLMKDGRFFPDEAWVDPRVLVPAIARAAVAAGVRLHEHAQAPTTGLRVIAKGAWAAEYGVKPIKGVLLRVKTRVEHIHYWRGGYAVPRPGDECVVGATMDDVGFDTSVTPADVARILEKAPIPLGEVVDSWAGLRPHAEKPILRRDGDTLVATGHFRNGILLAPHTAQWVATQLHP